MLIRSLRGRTWLMGVKRRAVPYPVTIPGRSMTMPDPCLRQEVARRQR